LRKKRLIRPKWVPGTAYRVTGFFPEGKAAGTWPWLHISSSAEVKERV